MSETLEPAEVDLRVEIGSLELANPILVASGCYAYGREFEPYGEVGALGAIIGKTITPEPRMGNEPPRKPLDLRVG